MNSTDTKKSGATGGANARNRLPQPEPCASTNSCEMMDWDDLIFPDQVTRREDCSTDEAESYPFDVGALIEASNDDQVIYLALDRCTFEALLWQGYPVTVAYFDVPTRRMRCDLPDIADWSEYRARIVSLELCPTHTPERTAINPARSFTASCLEEWAAYFKRAGLKKVNWHILESDLSEVKP